MKKELPRGGGVVIAKDIVRVREVFDRNGNTYDSLRDLKAGVPKGNLKQK